MTTQEKTQTFAEFLTELREVKPTKKFEPFAWYNAAGDSMEIYLTPEPHVSERVDELFTVFVSSEDRETVVGLAIKNIRKHFGEGGLGSKVLLHTSKATVSGLIYGALAGFQFHLSRAKHEMENPKTDRSKPSTRRVRRPKTAKVAKRARSERIDQIIDTLGDTEVSITNAEELQPTNG